MAQVQSRLTESSLITPRLQLVAWEITRTCNLACAHCRASAHDGAYEGELSTQECFRVVDQITEVASPIVILTGGEPLARQDVFEIAGYARSKGLRVVMGSNGTLITDDIAARLKEVQFSRVAVSLDFPTPDLQDKFRGQKGAFEAATAGIRSLKKTGLEVQINCTVTKLNAGHLEKLLSIALAEGAVAFHPFLLVPTGRGKGLESVELSPEEYESTLNWIYDRQRALEGKIFFKPTDAPHYLRVIAQRRRQGEHAAPPAHPGGHPANALTRGCLAGTGFAFISHRGVVQGCGYLELPAGDLKKQTFGQVWRESPLFNSLRDLANYKGKCGQCEYKRICGGCRARAYETTGDYLAAEPYCIYQPGKKRNE